MKTTKISFTNPLGNCSINGDCILDPKYPYTGNYICDPKWVILSHGRILNNCEGAIEILKPLIKKIKQDF